MLVAALSPSVAQGTLVEADAFYGMTSFGDLSSAEAEQIQTLGVHGARMMIDWSRVEPARECGASEAVEPNWRSIDARFEAAARHGITILPYVVGTRITAETTGCRHNDIPLPGTSLFSDFVRSEGFVGRLVRRYGRGGSFWTEHRSILAEYPVRVWEIWNEPNYSIYHQNERTNPQAYAKLLTEAGQTIHREGEANTKVLIGGLNPSGEAEFMDIRQFVGEMYDPRSINEVSYTVAQLNEAYDGMAYHPYRLSDPPSAVKEAVRTAHSVLRQNRVAERKTLWITEIGWPTFTVREREGRAEPIEISHHKQANYLWGTLRWLHNHSGEREAEELRIKYAAWFVYQDQLSEGRTCTHWYCWPDVAGLRTVEGADKESWCAYSRLTGARLSCSYTAPATIRADRPNASASNGSPGAASVSGSVTLPDTPEQHLNGVSARLVFQRWSEAEEEWLDDTTTPVTVLSDRYSVADQALSPGLWRVRLDHPYDEVYEEDESEYATFELAAGYQIKSRHSGKCLDVELPEAENWTYVVQRPCGDPVREPSQVWRLVPRGEDEYQITNYVGGRCLDVVNEGLLSGALVWVYDCDREGLLANQIWRPEATTGLVDPYIHLRAKHSGKCLEIQNAARLTDALLVQRTCREPALTYPAQAWKLVAAEVQELTPGRLSATALVLRAEQRSGPITLTNVGPHYIEADADLFRVPGFSLATSGNCTHLAPGEECTVTPTILAETRRPTSTLLSISYTSLGRQYVHTSEVRAE